MNRLLVLLLMLVAPLVGACGGDDGGVDTATASAGRAAFPVTVDSQFGSVTIEGMPQRVVALDNQAADAALALGVTPVAIAKVTYVPGAMQAWTEDALGRADVELLDTDTGIPYERVAALRPDVILAPHLFSLDESIYDKLSRIAPVVASETGPLKDSWQDTTLRVGTALGRAQEARELVADAEAELAEARRATPRFDGATVNIFNADPSGLYAINDPQDYAVRFMGDLGMELSPRVRKLKGESGRALISQERYDLLDADLVIGTSVSPEALDALGRDELFRRVGAVGDGRFVALEMGPATALAFPSVLSVRHAAREVVPALARAMQGGEA